VPLDMGIRLAGHPGRRESAGLASAVDTAAGNRLVADSSLVVAAVDTAAGSQRSGRQAVAVGAAELHRSAQVDSSARLVLGHMAGRIPVGLCGVRR